jgi:hypothetical protein
VLSGQVGDGLGKHGPGPTNTVVEKVLKAAAVVESIYLDKGSHIP